MEKTSNFPLAIFYFVAHFGAQKHVLLALPTDFRNALNWQYDHQCTLM